jgi:hypothetical protein
VRRQHDHGAQRIAFPRIGAATQNDSTGTQWDAAAHGVGNELEPFGGYTAQGEAAARTHTEKLARLWKQIPFRVMWDEVWKADFREFRGLARKLIRRCAVRGDVK